VLAAFLHKWQTNNHCTSCSHTADDVQTPSLSRCSTAATASISRYVTLCDGLLTFSVSAINLVILSHPPHTSSQNMCQMKPACHLTTTKTLTRTDQNASRFRGRKPLPQITVFEGCYSGGILDCGGVRGCVPHSGHWTTMMQLINAIDCHVSHNTCDPILAFKPENLLQWLNQPNIQQHGDSVV